jgi:hypothetical protein
MEGWWLIVARPHAEPEIECYPTAEMLAEVLRQLTDESCRPYVVRGTRHLLSARPHRYLLLSDAPPLPLFELPSPESLVPELDTVLGDDEELFWDPDDRETALDEIAAAAEEEAAELSETQDPEPEEDNQPMSHATLENSANWGNRATPPEEEDEDED